MAKSGQARVLSNKQRQYLFEVIQQHRHPEKNTAIMQISFKLGLRAHEITLLQLKEIAKLNNAGTDFKLLEIMSLPAAYTSGIEKASSHSGRRSLITNIIHKQKKSVKVAQKIAGHVNASTTIIYEEPPEEILEEALKNL